VCLEQLSSVATALGLDLSIRFFPTGDPIRDVAHGRLLERLHQRLPSSLTWHVEVPLPLSGDLRAWDAVISGPGWRIAVEAETRIADVQSLERRLTLKRRDGRVENVLLLIADTRANRMALDSVKAGAIADLPLDPRLLLGALADGRDPGGSGIVVL
jgi:hypothetical protein